MFENSLEILEYLRINQIFMNKFFHGINMVTSTAALLLPISNKEKSV